jgi:hypothetical protein
MATIIQTRAKVYSDTTGTTQVGQTIVVQGAPPKIDINKENLGVDLNPGSQYSVSVQCTNDEDYTTDWTSPYPYKTLILAELVSFMGGQGAVKSNVICTYTEGVLSINDAGVYLSTNISGAGAVKYSGTDAVNAGQSWGITGLNENTTYYAVPYVVDDLGREYIGDWANAESANTGYDVPAVTISNVATTYNNISGNVLVTTNDTLASVKLSIIPTGGGESQYKTLSATTGTQAWSITNGDLDDLGNSITINPSTEYKIQIEAINTSGGTSTAQAIATTAVQATETIAITGVTSITPISATVNLSYGSVVE